MVTKNKKKPKIHPSWVDVKARVAEFDHAGLLAMVQDLYALSKATANDNRTAERGS